ncbi:MAG TPA: PsiF family protein [Ideonella sp.]|nr:PsiF family protein [Ideonella sp.]
MKHVICALTLAAAALGLSAQAQTPAKPPPVAPPAQPTMPAPVTPPAGANPTPPPLTPPAPVTQPAPVTPPSQPAMAAPPQPGVSPAQAKIKACRAGTKGMTRDQRKVYMKSCLSQ